MKKINIGDWVTQYRTGYWKVKELHPKYSPFDCDRLHKGEPIGVEAVLQKAFNNTFKFNMEMSTCDLIVSSVSVFMTDRLFGKIYPPSRRKAVMQHYAGRKFSPFRRNLFFFPLYLLLIPAMVLLGTALKWITEILK